MKQPLKILGVEPYTRLRGHAEWFATRICEGIALRGHDTTLLTFGGISSEARSSGPTFKLLDVASVRSNGSPRFSHLFRTANADSPAARWLRLGMEMKTF